MSIEEYVAAEFEGFEYPQTNSLYTVMLFANHSSPEYCKFFPDDDARVSDIAPVAFRKIRSLIPGKYIEMREGVDSITFVVHPD